MKPFFRDLLTTLLIAVVIFLGLRATIQSIIIEGPSMNLSFHDGQRILVNKTAYDFQIGAKTVYHFQEPQRGDVIILNPSPSHNPGATPFIKRIIGLPGESVEIKEGIVYIHQEDGNTLPLNEPYITEQAELPFMGAIIPENAYFVLGDNRNNSDDSRNGWTVPRQNIIGKVWLSIWPPDKWGLAANYSLQEQTDTLANNK